MSMNIQQLEYIVALDNHRNFGKAAKACFVTQPTLSMMVQKLEQELELTLFDRAKQPIEPTADGKAVIHQVRTILQEMRSLQLLVEDRKMHVQGELSIGVSPTLAPYLITLFIRSFLQKYPRATLKIEEFKTEVLIDRVRRSEIDLGILATPVQAGNLTVDPLFYEEFLVYGHEKGAKTYVPPEDIDPDELWLLEEGHCLRSQIVNLCELRKKRNPRLAYQSGSLESLKWLVENHQGITILPELATLPMSDVHRERLSHFTPPAPVREVSFLYHAAFAKSRLLTALREEIIANLPEGIQTSHAGYVVPIESAKA